ncbi:uncharacterized protein LOC142974875 [Anticarsia gemmatalis]|uniref:uncharacterized protein LOC142974875 n=1 Tax=Anticarsia gemmatalis TaxID=129554 RepID=UPI003F777E74
MYGCACVKEGIPELRQRSQSPVRNGFRVTSSAPAPMYRESNASRLRQERGMSLSNKVNNPRSTSSSTTSSQKSPRRSPCRSPPSPPPINGDANNKPAKEPSPDKCENENPSSEGAPPSGIPVSKTAQERARSREHSAEYVIDTRSKTLNSVPRNAVAAELVDLITDNVKNSASVHFREPQLSSFKPPASSPQESTGYGKPLVTPINKKLCIRRVPTAPVPGGRVSREMNSPSTSGSRTRSPSRTRPVASRGPSPVVNGRSQSGNARAPTKGTVSGNTLRTTNNSQDTKIPVARNNFPVRNPNIKPMQHDTREVPKGRIGANLISPARSPTRGRSPIPKPKHDVTKSPAPKPPLYSAIKSQVHIINKEHSNNTSTLNRANPNLHGSSKSFKPQLEDIKSSFLLLNNTQDGHEKTCPSGDGSSSEKTCSDEKKEVSPVSPPIAVVMPMQESYSAKPPKLLDKISSSREIRASPDCRTNDGPYYVSHEQRPRIRNYRIPIKGTVSEVQLNNLPSIDDCELPDTYALTRSNFIFDLFRPLAPKPQMLNRCLSKETRKLCNIRQENSMTTRSRLRNRSPFPTVKVKQGTNLTHSSEIPASKCLPTASQSTLTQKANGKSKSPVPIISPKIFNEEMRKQLEWCINI